MTDILKKRFRKIIRKHFEEKFTKSYERTKDLYQLLAFMDSVMEEVEVDDLIPTERREQVKIINELVGNLYDQTWRERIFPIASPTTGKIVNVVISLR